MKDIAIKKDGLTNRLSFYHLGLFLIALPFDRFYSELIFISFMLHTLIHLKKESLLQLRRKEIWILPSVFFISVICTLYSNNKAEAYSLWMRQLTILLFPLLLFLNPIDLRKYSQRILTAFAVTCTLVICYLFYDALKIIVFTNLPVKSLFSPAFTNHQFSAPVDIHATYLSLLAIW